MLHGVTLFPQKREGKSELKDEERNRLFFREKGKKLKNAMCGKLHLIILKRHKHSMHFEKSPRMFILLSVIIYRGKKFKITFLKQQRGGK